MKLHTKTDKYQSLKLKKYHKSESLSFITKTAFIIMQHADRLILKVM